MEHLLKINSLKLNTIVLFSMFLITLSSVSFSDRTVYLSDVPEYIASITQGWGEIGWDVSAHATGHSPMQLQIGDKSYKKGIGHHAPGEIVVDLNGRYKFFECEVGIQKQDGSNKGSVVFQVIVDGEIKFDSGIRKELDSSLPVKVDINGAYGLRLVVNDGGDGITCDCANWADARLVEMDVVNEKQSGLDKLDIAPFAEVITCNPKRYDGVRCSRVEEFPAEDIFLETVLSSEKEGIYKVANYDELNCIGLRWCERRKLTDISIQFLDGKIPDEIWAEVWVGESPWQGKWQKLNGNIEAKGMECSLHILWRDNLFIWEGTEKVRWIFNGSGSVSIKNLCAYSNSFWDKTSIRLENKNVNMSGQANIQIYNGKFLNPDSSDYQWEISKPLMLELAYSVPKPDKGDRTLLWIAMPDTKFCVAVEDILKNQYVYVPDAGFFAALNPSSLTIDDYKKIIDGKKSVLDNVRILPEQTFSKAMEKVHRPIQDNGPTMLSLACDNNKFIVERDGSIRFGDFDVKVQIGNKNEIKRSLFGGWLPIPIVEKVDDNLIYSLMTFVAPYKETEPLCISSLEIKNTDDKEKEADICFSFYSNKKENKKAVLEKENQIVYIKDGGKILGVCKADDNIFEIDEEKVFIKHQISPGSSIKLSMIIPSNSNIKPTELMQLNEADALNKTVKYWEKLLATSIEITVPEPLINNLIKASQVHCLISARSENNGSQVAPWIASMSYGPLESEAHSIVYGMDLMGWHEFSRKALEFFISKYNDSGYLTTGYTLMGTGWHLWTLAEHYHLTKDKEWLAKYADKLSRVCNWIVNQCEKTKIKDIHGEKPPEYGLMPPGVGADWNRFAYRFAIQSHFYAGLARTGAILKEINVPMAEKYIENAEEFKASILSAYEWNKARTPVLPLSNGKWVLPYPPQLYCFGTSGEMFPGEDSGRSWAYDVELGPHHLIPLGVLDPNSKDTENIIQHLEDYWFLHSDYWFAFSGKGDYSEEENRKDWFNLGGFSKIQPYYTRIAEVYALRDEVKPFIRSYFNAIPSLLNTENLSFWEHFHNIGAWNKTHETGWFLVQTRKMFVAENEDSLWLAPFIPSYWLEDGKQVVVNNADTYFGKVSYSLNSQVNNGEINGYVSLTKDSPLDRVILRIRHPSNKLIKKVLVNNSEYEKFDPQLSVIYLYPVNTEEKWAINCIF